MSQAGDQDLADRCEWGMNSFGDSSFPAPWHGEKVCCGTRREGAESETLWAGEQSERAAGVLRRAADLREGGMLLRYIGGGVAHC